MNIIFAGTPVFAATALDALIKEAHDIVLVLTQPDRPAGRGMKTVSSPVKQLATKYELPLLQPHTLKKPELLEQLHATHADLLVVAAYGLILPEPVLSIPRQGCVNIHASLLPRWRGAAPIQRAILAGDQETGITIMQMDAGLDTGAMLLKEKIPISDNDTTQMLHDKLCVLGAFTIVKALSLLQQNKLTPIQQDEALACYAPKIKKSEAYIDWHKSAEEIERKIRAFNPTPGTFIFFHSNKIKVWQAHVAQKEKATGKPGEIISIVSDGITVACGKGSIRLEVIQKPGGKRLNTAEFLTGFNINPGDSFDTHINAAITNE